MVRATIIGMERPSAQLTELARIDARLREGENPAKILSDLTLRTEKMDDFIVPVPLSLAFALITQGGLELPPDPDPEDEEGECGGA